MIVIKKGRVEIHPEQNNNTHNGFKLISGSPRVKKYYRIEYKNRVYEGTLERVAMVRTGAVLGFGSWGHQGIPITKYAKWYERTEINS